MNVLAPGLTWVDLEYQGVPSAIVTAVVSSAEGVGLIDPGPAISLPVLEAGLHTQGLYLADVRWLLLTHVHLDHAGATGAIVERCPDVMVYVHERGARHMHDPARLIASAERLYGNSMGRQWGAVLPVPEKNLQSVGDGDRVLAGGRSFEVADTPGHASHHVSYYESESGVAFVGDTAGVCIDGGYVLAPTPPPDIDLELWDRSVERILAWSPDSLFLTHFGSIRAPRPHLRTLQENLHATARIVRELLDEEPDEEARRVRFVRWLEGEIAVLGLDAGAYGVALPLALGLPGLERYWRKQR